MNDSANPPLACSMLLYNIIPNIYQALINTIDKYPGVVNGVFGEENWMGSDELWADYWAGRRTFSIRGKPAEEVIRSAYQSYKQATK